MWMREMEADHTRFKGNKQKIYFDVQLMSDNPSPKGKAGKKHIETYQAHSCTANINFPY